VYAKAAAAWLRVWTDYLDLLQSIWVWRILAAAGGQQREKGQEPRVQEPTSRPRGGGQMSLNSQYSSLSSFGSLSLERERGYM
jgi:hypothetical protein